jgi:hypothetical protein
MSGLLDRTASGLIVDVGFIFAQPISEVARVRHWDPVVSPYVSELSTISTLSTVFLIVIISRDVECLICLYGLLIDVGFVFRSARHQEKIMQMSKWVMLLQLSSIPWVFKGEPTQPCSVQAHISFLIRSFKIFISKLLPTILGDFLLRFSSSIHHSKDH